MTLTEDTIDRRAIDRLLNVIGGDPDDLLELLDDFEKTTPGLVTAMRAGALAGDRDQIRIPAHSLKSNSRDFGALRLASLCEALEHACKQGDPDDALSDVEAIDGELTAARAALTAMFRNDG